MLSVPENCWKQTVKKTCRDCLVNLKMGLDGIQPKWKIKGLKVNFGTVAGPHPSAHTKRLLAGYKAKGLGKLLFHNLILDEVNFSYLIWCIIFHHLCIFGSFENISISLLVDSTSLYDFSTCQLLHWVSFQFRHQEWIYVLHCLTQTPTAHGLNPLTVKTGHMIKTFILTQLCILLLCAEDKMHRILLKHSFGCLNILCICWK